MNKVLINEAAFNFDSSAYLIRAHYEEEEEEEEAWVQSSIHS